MLGRLLRDARKRAFLSQAEVAQQAGIDRSYLSDLERDRKSVSLRVFLRICHAMKTSAADIVREVEQSEAKQP